MIRDKEFTRDKLWESSCRGYQQCEARLGDQRDWATAKTGKRKTKDECKLSMTRPEPDTVDPDKQE